MSGKWICPQQKCGFKNDFKCSKCGFTTSISRDSNLSLLWDDHVIYAYNVGEEGLSDSYLKFLDDHFTPSGEDQNLSVANQVENSDIDNSIICTNNTIANDSSRSLIYNHSTNTNPHKCSDLDSDKAENSPTGSKDNYNISEVEAPGSVRPGNTVTEQPHSSQLNLQPSASDINEDNQTGIQQTSDSSEPNPICIKCLSMFDFFCCCFSKCSKKSNDSSSSQPSSGDQTHRPICCKFRIGCMKVQFTRAMNYYT